MNNVSPSLCVCDLCRIVEFRQRLIPSLRAFGFRVWDTRRRGLNTYFIGNSKGAVWALFVYHPGLDVLLTRWDGVNFDDDDGTIHSIVLTVLFEMEESLDAVGM